MAARTAAATGNWSNPAIWDGGVSVPGVGDTVNCNGFTVTIDQDVTVASLLNTVAGGGAFTCSTSRTITANIPATPSRTVLLCPAAAPVVVTFVGNVVGGGSSVRGIDKSGSGTLNVTGDVLGGSQGAGILVQAGTVNVTGAVTGGSGTNGVGVQVAGGTAIVNGAVTGSANAHGMSVSSTGGSATVIGGPVTGGTGASVCGINNAGRAPVCSTGNIVGGSASGAYGVDNAATGPVILLGTQTNNTANAINHAGGGTTYACGAAGAVAILPARAGMLR